MGPFLTLHDHAGHHAREDQSKKIVEDMHSPSVKSTVDDALSMVASILTDRPLVVPVKAEAGKALGDASGGYAKLVAFLQERGVNLTVPKASGRAKKQARKAAAALAAATSGTDGYTALQASRMSSCGSADGCRKVHAAPKGHVRVRSRHPQALANRSWRAAARRQRLPSIRSRSSSSCATLGSASCLRRRATQREQRRSDGEGRVCSLHLTAYAPRCSGSTLGTLGRCQRPQSTSPGNLLLVLDAPSAAAGGLFGTL